MGQLAGRVDRLEQVVRPSDRAEEDTAAAERFGRYWDAWNALASTLSDEHLAGIESDLAAGNIVRFPNGRVAATSDASRVSQIASDAVWKVIEGWSHGPLALPDAVIQVYLDDPEARPNHECEACGYEIPVHSQGSGRGDGQGGIVYKDQARTYFDRCPLCDGRVGYWAYGYTMQGRIKRCQTCGDLQATDDEERQHLVRHGRAKCQCESSLAWIGVA